MIFEINVLTVVVIALVGGLCSLLATKSVAVFNDGLRPIVPQFLNGVIDRKTLFATSFALSFGLVVGFGIPTSIAGQIILIHTVLLGTDIIGVAFNDTPKGNVLSVLAGSLFGVALMFGMQAIMTVFTAMPVDFVSSLGSVGNLIVISFAIFPAVAVAQQTNFKNGAIVFGLILATKQLFFEFGTIVLGSGTEVKINSDGMALLVGMIAMMYFASKSGEKGKSSNASVFSVFEDNVANIKKNVVILSIAGGLIALATTLLIIAEGPGSLELMADGEYTAAAMVAFGRMLGFIPLVMTTAIISGVYAPSGTKAIHIPAILFINMGIFGLVGSFVTGCLIMAVEIMLLGYLAKGMDKFPGMKDLGDHTRSAMSSVMELALLVGGMIAAHAISPSIGYIWIMGLYFLNKSSKKPVSTMAIGPIGAITLGLIVNVLYVLGLFTI